MSYLHPERRPSDRRSESFCSSNVWGGGGGGTFFHLNARNGGAVGRESAVLSLRCGVKFRSSLSLTDCDEQKDPTMAHEILAVLAEMAQCHGSELRAQLWQH